MNLIEYFENKKGSGILATADADGNVDGAPYSKPHFEDGHTVMFIHGGQIEPQESRNESPCCLYFPRGRQF